MDGDEEMWSAEDILLAEEAILHADRLASSRAAGSSTPVAEECSNRRRKRCKSSRQKKLAGSPSSIRTRSKARSGEQEGGAAAAEQSPSAAGGEAVRAGGSPGAVSRGAVEADPTAAVAAAITELAVIPEVEELGAVLDRRRLRPYGFSVTDITAAEWCQQQLALALTARLPKVCGCVMLEPKEPEQMLTRHYYSHTGGVGGDGGRQGAACGAGGGGQGGRGRGGCHQGGRVGGEAAGQRGLPAAAAQAGPHARGLRVWQHTGEGIRVCFVWRTPGMC